MKRLLVIVVVLLIAFCIGTRYYVHLYEKSTIVPATISSLTPPIILPKPDFFFTMADVTMYGGYPYVGHVMADGKIAHVGAIACPRIIPLGTKVKILNIVFTCEDHTAQKYDGRYDIYSEGSHQDMLNFGKRNLLVGVMIDPDLLKKSY